MDGVVSVFRHGPVSTHYGMSLFTEEPPYETPVLARTTETLDTSLRVSD